MKPVPLCLAALLPLVSLAGCNSAPVDPSLVKARDDFFEPATFALVAGATVTWKATERNAHTVTVQEPNAPPGTYLYDKVLNPGDSTNFAFTTSGTYDVFCRYHSSGAHGDFASGMVMKVTVS